MKNKILKELIAVQKQKTAIKSCLNMEKQSLAKKQKKKNNEK